jgi:hypothetical protein
VERMGTEPAFDAAPWESQSALDRAFPFKMRGATRTA